MVGLLQGDHALGKQYYEEALEDLARRREEQRHLPSLLCKNGDAYRSSRRRTAGSQGSRALQSAAVTGGRRSASQLESGGGTQGVRALRRVLRWEWDKEQNVHAEKRGLTAKGVSAVSVARHVVARSEIAPVRTRAPTPRGHCRACARRWVTEAAALRRATGSRRRRPLRRALWESALRPPTPSGSVHREHQQALRCRTFPDRFRCAATRPSHLRECPAF